MTFNVLLILVCLSLFSPISGCGQLPQRQARTINFEITDFKLPAAMVYSVESTAPSKVPNISTSKQQAVTFVQNIIVQSVEEILHQQGRGAGLSDDLISLILSQLDVTVKYTPLKCDIVFTDPTGNMVGEFKMIEGCDGDIVEVVECELGQYQYIAVDSFQISVAPNFELCIDVMPDMINCQIIGGTVTKTCPDPMPNGGNGHMCPPAMLQDIEEMYLNISGSITTTNVIMANWSTQMWQIVLNRALRSLSTGLLRSQFVGAYITSK